jgi:Tfp pilus assembly protein FimT
MNPKTQADSKLANGFTLIELLVVIATQAVVVVLELVALAESDRRRAVKHPTS